MRRIASIGLLALLLYNMFGLSFAVLLFEKDYQAAASRSSGDAMLMKLYLPSLPYSGDLEVTGQIDGLIRHEDNFYNPTQVIHQNDTLYVTLQANQAARDHFFELANAVQLLSDPHTDLPKSPYSKAVELLGSLLKIYIPFNQGFAAWSDHYYHQPLRSFNSHFQAVSYRSFETALATPPPERC